MDFVSRKRATLLQLVSGLGHEEAVIDRIRAAKRSVWIATANLKDLWVKSSAVRSARGPDGPSAGRRERYVTMLSVLDALATRGVDLRILHATLPSMAFRDSFDSFARLVQGGLELRMCPRVHFKVVIVDGLSLYLGSANWTGAGLGLKTTGRRNFELGISTEDLDLLDHVQALYQHIWSGHCCAECGRRDVCDAPLDQ